MSRPHLLIATLLLLAAPVSRAADLTLEGGSTWLRLDDRTGAVAGIGQKGQSTPIVTAPEGLWQVRFDDGSTLSARQFPDPAANRLVSITYDPAARTARLDFSSPELHVDLLIQPDAEGLDIIASVTPSRRAVLEVLLPGRLRFDPATLARLVTPVQPHQGVGVALQPAFFQPQPADHPTAWEPHSSGPAAFRRLLPDGVLMLEMNAPPIHPQVTDEGSKWFGPELSAKLGAASVDACRPTRRERTDVVLLDSPGGPLLAASRLGGKTGALWRWGGFVRERERSTVLDALSATIAHLAREDHSNRPIALLEITNGPERGSADIPVAAWRERLERIGRELGRPLALLDGRTPLPVALEARFLAVLNPYGEWLPVTPNTDLARTADAIAAYVRDGGHWFEVGGYPFYASLEPVRFLGLESAYPPLFADFFQVESKAAGSLAVFRLQPRAWEPWAGTINTASIFVPGRMAHGADNQGGWSERGFGTFVEPGKPWLTPSVRLAAGKPAHEQLAAYARANGITRTLREKLGPRRFETLRNAVLVKTQMNARELLAALDQLPVPTLVHPSNYLKGGFDKEYPDHLPPSPSYGTPADFRAVFDRAHALGHLMMPYTNPTWWCDHPRGPTFEKAGDAPLLLGLDGQPIHETYGRNDGWTTTLWHPAVQAANRELRRQFTENYPVDILFQDQCGARTWRYDRNPASPFPHAYAEGLLSLVDEDARVVPLGTEDGNDRVLNAESMLCGFTFALVPGRNPEWARPFRTLYPRSTWTLYPLAQILGHDKVVFLHHDLGKFVESSSTLAWTLGLGFNMSNYHTPQTLREARRVEWHRWLDRIQKSVAARYTGEPTLAFEHLQGGADPADDGLVRATYGPVRIVANLGPTPRADAGRTLSPHGFLATAPGLLAGDLLLTGPAGPSTPFVAETTGPACDLWLFAPPAREAAALLRTGLTAPVTVTLDGRPSVAAELADGVLRITLPAADGPPDVSRLWHARVVPR